MRRFINLIIQFFRRVIEMLRRHAINGAIDEGGGGDDGPVSTFTLDVSNAALPSSEGLLVYLARDYYSGYYMLDGEQINDVYLYISSGGNAQNTVVKQKLTFVATSDQTNVSFIGISFKRGKFGSSALYLGGSEFIGNPSMGSWSNRVVAHLSIYDNTAGSEIGSLDVGGSQYSSNTITNNLYTNKGQMTTGHVYTFDVTVTITSLS